MIKNKRLKNQIDRYNDLVKQNVKFELVMNTSIYIRGKEYLPRSVLRKIEQIINKKSATYLKLHNLDNSNKFMEKYFKFFDIDSDYYDYNHGYAIVEKACKSLKNTIDNILNRYSNRLKIKIDKLKNSIHNQISNYKDVKIELSGVLTK